MYIQTYFKFVPLWNHFLSMTVLLIRTVACCTCELCLILQQWNTSTNHQGVILKTKTSVGKSQSLFDTSFSLQTSWQEVSIILENNLQGVSVIHLMLTALTKLSVKAVAFKVQTSQLFGHKVRYKLQDNNIYCSAAASNISGGTFS